MEGEGRPATGEYWKLGGFCEDIIVYCRCGKVKHGGRKSIIINLLIGLFIIDSLL